MGPRELECARPKSDSELPPAGRMVEGAVVTADHQVRRGEAATACDLIASGVGV